MAATKKAGDKRLHETDDDEDDQERTAKEMKKKGKAYQQQFKACYRTDFPFVVSSKKGQTFAYCVVCHSDFSIAHGGRFDVSRHSQGKAHKEKEKATTTASRPISTFFDSTPKRDENSQKQKELQITRAEVSMCAFIAEANLPLSTADKLTKLTKRMFPDSEIAAGV